MPKVLLVDDDALFRRSVALQLERAGYSVATAESGGEAVTMARRDPPDLILLDIGLPDTDGLEVARTISREIQSPIIFLTGRSQVTDVVIGLELGAEDYIVKPPRMRELLARIRVVLRRPTRIMDTPSQTIIVGEISLDAQAHQVQVRGQRVDLPPKEFELLRLLMLNAGTVLSADYLLDAVWGEEYAGAVQVLYVHIGWLRERIETDAHNPHLILNVRSVGYKFALPEE